MKKLILAMLMLILAGGVGPSFGAAIEPRTAQATNVPMISANVGLSSLMSLSDGYLSKMADSLKILAQSDAARTGNWENIRGPLQQVANINVEAVNWFALPNGDYWTLQQGPAGNISDRPYFAQIMSGQTVIGPLVVSKSTGRSVAIVGVPVFGTDGKVIGALGASVYLDSLSVRLRTEMGITNEIFYSFDSTPLIALNWDPALIFTSPSDLGPEVSQAFNDMLTKNEGVETYTFRGTTRTVVFKKSNVTGWWYAFGLVQG